MIARHVSPSEALELYHQAVAARGGSFFWPTTRWRDGTRHFVKTPDAEVECPRCGSDVVILHGLHRTPTGVPVRLLTCGECYRNWLSSSPNAIAFDFTQLVYRG